MLSYVQANDEGKIKFEDFCAALVYVPPPPEEKKPEGEGEDGAEGAE